MLVCTSYVVVADLYNIYCVRKRRVRGISRRGGEVTESKTGGEGLRVGVDSKR